MKFDLQSFAEKAIENQTSNQLRKGIRSLNRDLELHLKKIENPEDYCYDWHLKDEREKAGLIKHWLHEIKNFSESIRNRINELEKRGEKL
ncbi:MAG: hypothetical protein IKI76_01625 [Selenomonadaceae bacterium]|nr:hypothetical protein [Selenomonadaceae bacterium]